MGVFFVCQSVSGCDECIFGVTAISVILGLKGDSNSYDFLFILFSENSEAINKKDILHFDDGQENLSKLFLDSSGQFLQIFFLSNVI